MHPILTARIVVSQKNHNTQYVQIAGTYSCFAPKFVFYALQGPVDEQAEQEQREGLRVLHPPCHRLDVNPS